MNKINIGLINPKKNLDPVEGITFMDFLLVQCVYQTLTRLDTNGNISSELVSSWTVSNDGKVYRFQIDPNAKFSNGESVKSKDVLFSLSRHGWKNSKSITKGYLADNIDGFKQIKDNEFATGLKIIDDKIFEIQLVKPYASFLHVLTMPGFAIVPFTDSLRKANVGSGRLTVTWFELQKQWKFIPNPNYSGSRIKLNEINVRFFSNDKEAFSAIHDDLVDVVLGMPFGSAEETSLPPGYEYHSTNSLAYSHFFYNMKRPKLENKSFRQNLGEVINSIAVKSIKNNLYFSHLNTLLPLGVLPAEYYQRTINSVDLNTFAKKWKNHIEANHLEIIYPERRLPDSFIKELTSSLGKVSSQIKILGLPYSEFSKRFGASEYDIGYDGYIGNFPDPDGFLDDIRENNFPGVNVNSRGLFERLNSVRNTQSFSERLKKYSAEIRKFEESWTIIPLFQMGLPAVLNKKIKLPETSYKYESELWNFLWKE